MEIASFDIIPVNWIWEKLFYLPPYQTLSMRFVAVGIKDSSLIGNIGSIFITVIAVVLLFGAASILQKTKSLDKIKSFRRYMVAQAFWKLPLTIFLEGYQVIALACLLAIKFPNTGSKGQMIETVLAYFFLVILIVLTILLPLTIHFNKQDVRIKKSKHHWRFKPLYEEMDLQNNHLAAFRFFFLLRRLLLASTIVLMETLAF